MFKKHHLLDQLMFIVSLKSVKIKCEGRRETRELQFFFNYDVAEHRL